MRYVQQHALAMRKRCRSWPLVLVVQKLCTEPETLYRTLEQLLNPKGGDRKKKAAEETVKPLLQAGASTSDEGGSTPLHAAARVGHTEAVKLLLAAGASVAAADKQGCTPLHAAARACNVNGLAAASEGHTEAVELLLAAGASVAAVNKQGDTPLHYTAGRGNAAA